jgi:hypothetical protein
MSADTETTPLINSERTIKENEEIQKSQSAENVKEEQFSFSKTTSRERWLLVSMALMNFFASTCFSLLAPFFPAEVSQT